MVLGIETAVHEKLGGALGHDWTRGPFRLGDPSVREPRRRRDPPREWGKDEELASMMRTGACSALTCAEDHGGLSHARPSGPQRNGCHLVPCFGAEKIVKVESLFSISTTNGYR